MAVLQSNTLTIIDQTDNRKLEVYIKSNMPNSQVFNSNTGAYSPDWSSGLQLTADVYLDSREVESYDKVSFVWKVDDGSSVTELIKTRNYTTTNNALATKPILTYICVASYQNISATSKIIFTRTDTGINGANGTSAPTVQAQYSANGTSGWTSTLNTVTHKYIRYSYDGGKTWTAAIKMVGEDGTSVNVKGTATSKAEVSGTSYYTLVYNGATITGAVLGDAYLLDGNMYVCVDSRDGNDYFMDVGRIQGPQGNDGQSSYVFIRYATDANGSNMAQSPSNTTTHIGICTVNTNVAPTTASSYTWSKFVGDSAKSIILSGTSQIFKVSKDATSIYTPTTITVTAQTVNTTVATWEYSVNGGISWATTTPAGVLLNTSTNTITVTGKDLISSTLVIRASNGIYKDIYTVYKIFDGTDGTSGQSASMAFLTNENISFSANSNGQIPLATFTTNVVAYSGTTKVTPTIGTITGLPSGMTVIPNKGTAYSSVTPSAGNLTVADLYTSNSLATKIDKAQLNDGDSFVVGNYLYIYNLSAQNFKCQSATWQGMERPSVFVVNNEIVLTFTISNNSTLGSTSSNSDTITIPITSPISTNLKLSWSKINTGAAGVGINSVTVDYGVSDSSSTQPTTWQQTIPVVADGKYLWTRTITDYTSDAITDTVTYVYAKQGSKGDAGTSGSSVTVSSIQYQVGASATVAPTGAWSNTVVAASDGAYLWTKTTFSDGKIAYGVAKQGADGAVGTPGVDAVTFQIYSSNGYALSTNIPTVTLQTFAYVGDIAITAGATYKWYVYGSTGWSEVANGTNAYLTVTREDVEFSKSYMCKMTFNGVEYASVATIDDKNDENKVFTTKPFNYSAGDLWVVGVDYIPVGIESGTLLRAEHTNSSYKDSDWITATKYDEKIDAIQNNIDMYNQYFSFDSTDGLRISARDASGTASKFSTSLTNERLSFNYGNESIAYINGTKMNIKEAEIESPLTITGKYSGSTMLQAPVINIGNFSIVVEGNGSLSIVANI